MIHIKHIELNSPEALGTAQTEAMTQVFARAMHAAWRSAGSRSPLTINNLSVDLEPGAATSRALLKQAAARTVSQIMLTQREQK